MCNLYNQNRSQAELTALFKGLSDNAGNVAPGEVYPNYLAPILRHGADGPELVKAR